MFRKLIHTFLNFLFPQKCAVCGKENEIICDKCLAKIDYSNGAPRPYIFAASAYYDACVKKTIWLLKYRGVKGAAEPLAKLIYERILEARLPNVIVKSRAFNKSKWLLIPIPLSQKRLKERGFNQSELIGKYLSVRMSVRMETNVLYKKFHTETQVSVMDRNERLKNLKGSFDVKNSELIKNTNIILVDDVATTGATISEARKVLREAGAKKIIGAVAASG